MINKSISVIIPAYNEEENIRSAVQNTYEFLRSNFPDFEIIVVDDGSNDKTAKALNSLSNPPLKILLNGANKGKGYSVRRGVEAAQKDYILLCDADLSTPFKELNRFFDYIAEGYDIVIGSRALPESHITARQGFLRQSMGKIFNLFVRLILFGGIKDTQCGFKCFKGPVAKRIFAYQRINRFCFDAEILYIARSRGLKIKEAGVQWANRPASRVNIFKDSLNMFMDLLRIRINIWKGLYDTTSHDAFPPPS